MRQLKEPKNRRHISPRSCGTCQYFSMENRAEGVKGTLMGCIRDGPVEWSNDTVDDFFFIVCDYWKRP